MIRKHQKSFLKAQFKSKKMKNYALKYTKLRFIMMIVAQKMNNQFPKSLEVELTVRIIKMMQINIKTFIKIVR